MGAGKNITYNETGMDRQIDKWNESQKYATAVIKVKHMTDLIAENMTGVMKVENMIGIKRKYMTGNKSDKQV